MKLELKKFGEILSSRPAGREAALVVQAYLRPATPAESIELDFAGVKVLAPSWVDEFLTGIKAAFPNQIVLLPSTNASVIESLKVLAE